MKRNDEGEWGGVTLIRPAPQGTFSRQRGRREWAAQPLFTVSPSLGGLFSVWKITQ